MIAEDIKRQIKEAMKKGDKLRMSTLKLLSSELHNAEIDSKGGLSAEEEMQIVKKEAKKRRDAIEMYEKAERNELVEKETAELEILKEFLPEELSDNELEQIVNEAIKKAGAQSMQQMGQVMGLAMDKVAGRADGSRVSQLVKQKLS